MTTTDDELFDDIARWQADAVEQLGLDGVELVSALSPGPGFPGMLGALADQITARMEPGATPGQRARVRVVDLGAGLGGATAWLVAATGATVIGVEPADGARDSAHRLFGGLDVRGGDAAATGLDDGSADVVTAIGVVSLLDDLDGLFAEARRLLRPGGFLGIVDMFLPAGGVEAAPPNTLRSVAATTEAAGRAGFVAAASPPAAVPGAPDVLPPLDAPAGSVGADADEVSVIAAGDAEPAASWVAAADRLTAAVADAHPGSPAVERWLADRRRLSAWMATGHVVAACLTLSPSEDAGPRRVAGDLLQIYLQDHHAASAAGIARMRRLADAEADSPDGTSLDRLAREIAEDGETLSRVMRALEVQPKRSKEIIATVAEKAGLLKRNGRLVRRSPLTTFVELEAMTIAVRGKLAGWTSLRAALGSGHLGGIDIDDLIARSEEHEATLTEIHDRRAAEVLAFEDR